MQLICVQTSIVILNSLFNEITDELKLWLNNTPRELNFYEILEKNTYRELPEIDVAMITSSVGITCLNNFGFICSNISFQLSSSFWFLLLFLLFDFHTEAQLLENYTRLEILVLVLSYIFLSILVGNSSTIAIKEFADKYYDVYYKKKDQENGEKLLFYFFSAISAFIIMPINRKIFTSFNDKTSKSILIRIVIICFISFGLSIVFYGLYLTPITTKKTIIKNKTKKKMQDKKTNKIRKDENSIINKIENENKKVKNSQTNKNENEIEIITINRFESENEEIKKSPTNKIEIENEEIKNNQKNKIENEREEIKEENSQIKLKEENSQIIRKKNKNKDKKISMPLDYELEITNINQSFPQNKEKIEKIRENNIKKKKSK